LKHISNVSVVFKKKISVFILGFLAVLLIIFSCFLGFHGTVGGKIWLRSIPAFKYLSLGCDAVSTDEKFLTFLSSLLLHVQSLSLLRNVRWSRRFLWKAGNYVPISRASRSLESSSTPPWPLISRWYVFFTKIMYDIKLFHITAISSANLSSWPYFIVLCILLNNGQAVEKKCVKFKLQIRKDFEIDVDKCNMNLL
jgi:hypothetical protein